MKSSNIYFDADSESGFTVQEHAAIKTNQHGKEIRHCMIYSFEFNFYEVFFFLMRSNKLDCFFINRPSRFETTTA